MFENYRDLSFAETFGIDSVQEFLNYLKYIVPKSLQNTSFQIGLTSLGFVRPDLSLPAYLGLYPKDRLAPIYHLFDRTGGGKQYSQRITRAKCRDFRGKALTYDDHNGVDFVCPPGTNLTAAADGHVVHIRRRFLRGGTTVTVDHGYGLLTQYTHCARALKKPGDLVRCGEPVALSGAQGMDMTLFFPWVPPHIHFTVWYQGLPVDPYLEDNEPEHAGCWRKRNQPEPYTGQPSTDIPPLSEYDEQVLQQLVGGCTDPEIKREISQWQHDRAALAALLEDSLLHDRLLWPESLRHLNVRPTLDPETAAKAAQIRLFMPLPAEHYDGAKFGDLF